MPPFTKLSCQGKVLEVGEMQMTSEGEKIQNITITDGTCTTVRITLWENEVETLKINKTYRFIGVMIIRVDKKKKIYLSTTNINCSIMEI